MDKVGIVVVIIAIIYIFYLVWFHWPRKPFMVIIAGTNKVVKKFNTIGEACQWISERYMVEGPNGPTYSLKRAKD